MTQVGDTIYAFDQNRRVYRRDANNRPFGAPIYAEYFRPEVIFGETKKSWLVGLNGLNPIKVSKTTMCASGGRYSDTQYYTEEGKAERIWDAGNRFRLIDKMRAASVADLRKIAAILDVGQ